MGVKDPLNLRSYKSALFTFVSQVKLSAVAVLQIFFSALV